MTLYGAFSFGGWSGFANTDGGNAGVVVGTDTGLAPFEGSQHFTFNGADPSSGGWIEQAITTTPGQSYLVTFALGRSGTLLGFILSARFTARASDTTLLHDTNHAPPAGFGYASHSVTLTALDNTTTLRWTDISGTNTSQDLYLDGVSVTPAAIPEPAAFGAVMGLVALVLARRFRFNSPPTGRA